MINVDTKKVLLTDKKKECRANNNKNALILSFIEAVALGMPVLGGYHNNSCYMAWIYYYLVLICPSFDDSICSAL